MSARLRVGSLIQSSFGHAGAKRVDDVVGEPVVARLGRGREVRRDVELAERVAEHLFLLVEHPLPAGPLLWGSRQHSAEKAEVFGLERSSGLRRVRMREAWRELMFADSDQLAKATRDPVAPARRSAAAQHKAATHRLDDGTPAHSFCTLMAELATIARNTCRTPDAGPDAPTFDVVTTPNATQRHALDLIKQIRP